MNEFALIEQFFKSIAIKRQDVLFGIGDDAACVHVPNVMDLLVSTDTLVSEVHFLPEWDAYDIAYRSVMVNVSDMAAMAAEPCWVTLALTLPHVNESWLSRFSEGLKAALNHYPIDLIGGDTTRGSLSITLTIMGQAPRGQSVRRNGAKTGDIIMVTGELGAAALAVQLLDKAEIRDDHRLIVNDKLLHPKPRIDFIHLLRRYASSAIDISDGLCADLNHICVSSGVGALLEQNAIPIHPLVRHYLKDHAMELAMTGGDDYELCFTISPEQADHCYKEAKKAGLKIYPIGVIDNDPGIRMMSPVNRCVAIKPKGYTHF